MRRTRRQATTLAVFCAFSAVHAGATPPTPPGRVTLEPKAIAGQLAEARTVAIPLAVQLTDTVVSAEVTVVLRRVVSPLNARETEKDAQRFVTEIKPGSPQQHAPVMKIAEFGDFEIDARLVGKTRSGGGFSDRALAYLIVSPDGRYRALTPKEWTRARRKAREERFNDALSKDPRDPQIRLLMEDTVPVPPGIEAELREHQVPQSRRMIARPSGPPEGLRRYIVDKSASSATAPDPITIRGRLIYLDYDGAWRPLVNVSIDIMDEDYGSDEYVGPAVTDWNGNWSFSTNNDDGWLQDGRDIYYVFHLASTGLAIEDCDGIDSLYSWVSATREDVADGTVVDFGTETGTSGVGAMQVWNHLNLAWNHSINNGGFDTRRRIESCFPAGRTAWDHFWEEIDIEAQYVDGPDVIFHEYGHAVMFYAYDEDLPGPGGAHAFDECSQNPGLAWSEGWATGFMLAGRPDGEYNWHEGDPGENIEQFNSLCREGPKNEGRVAAALLDMVDQSDDCNAGDENIGRNDICDVNSTIRIPFTTMLRDTMSYAWHSDLTDYWASLSGELPFDVRIGAGRVMYYNWMPGEPPTFPFLCVASRVVAGAETDADGLLAGLRKVRDNGLKTFPGGRRLTRLYYRHSPELALLLLEDHSQLERARRVARHFSKLGHDLSQEETARPYRDSKSPMIPSAIAADIDELMQHFEKRGGSDLKADLVIVRRAFGDVRELSLRDLTDKIRVNNSGRETGGTTRIHQSDLSNESRNALPELEKARQ